MSSTGIDMLIVVKLVIFRSIWRIIDINCYALNLNEIVYRFVFSVLIMLSHVESSNIKPWEQIDCTSYLWYLWAKRSGSFLVCWSVLHRVASINLVKASFIWLWTVIVLVEALQEERAIDVKNVIPSKVDWIEWWGRPVETGDGKAGGSGGSLRRHSGAESTQQVYLCFQKVAHGSHFSWLWWLSPSLLIWQFGITWDTFVFCFLFLTPFSIMWSKILFWNNSLGKFLFFFFFCPV